MLEVCVGLLGLKDRGHIRLQVAMGGLITTIMREFLRALLVAILWRHACLRRPTNLMDLPPEIRLAILHHASKRVDPRHSHTWTPVDDSEQDRIRYDGLGRLPVGFPGWPLHPLLQLSHQLRREAFEAVTKNNRLMFKLLYIDNGTLDRFLDLHETRRSKPPTPSLVCMALGRQKGWFALPDAHEVEQPSARRSLGYCAEVDYGSSLQKENKRSILQGLRVEFVHLESRGMVQQPLMTFLTHPLPQPS